MEGLKDRKHVQPADEEAERANEDSSDEGQAERANDSSDEGQAMAEAEFYRPDH